MAKGDRVVAYLPNVPETLVALPGLREPRGDLGERLARVRPAAVIDRFAQIEPKVLLAVEGYVHRGRPVDRSAELEAIRAGLPTLEHADRAPVRAGGELAFEPVPFDHPLYVLFSSGTTGLPKAIVHGHGGILLEHFKNLGLALGHPARRAAAAADHDRVDDVERARLRAAAAGSIVLFDGDTAWPELGSCGGVAEETEATIVGVSPAYLMACRKAGRADPALPASRALATAGSPLPAEGYDYVYEQLGPDVLLINGSGGTDVCSAIVSGGPMLPVYRGEIAGRCLGVDTAAFDLDGNEVVGELGELVIRQPMPSMPVRFWGDEDGSRYRAAYFDVYPGVWRQGDWVRFSRAGTCVITGR